MVYNDIDGCFRDHRIIGHALKNLAIRLKRRSRPMKIFGTIDDIENIGRTRDLRRLIFDPSIGDQ